MLWRLAWRNLWRNPRRTALTAGASAFAALLTVWALTVAEGSHERWIQQVVELYPGHVEVFLEGYREHGTLDFGMKLSGEARAALEELPHLRGWAPRLESWALALPDRDLAEGRAARLIGIDPRREAGVSELGQSVAEADGRLASGEVLYLGVELAKSLGVATGDSMVVVASDYYGSQSAERFTVGGTLALGDRSFDDTLVLLSLGRLQRFVEFPDGLSHVALFADQGRRTDALRAEAERIFPGPGYEVLGWHELLPDLVQMVILDDWGNYLMITILIVVVAFGLLNTVLMSVFERVHEFGVMRAMGSRPGRVFRLVMLESFLLSSLGIAVGMAIALPIAYWLQSLGAIPIGAEIMEASAEVFNIEPVLVIQVATRHLFEIPALLLAVGVIAALPPALRAARGRPVDALRGD
jgi:ABC-type lipoprotein release transport system permease subunit